MKELKKKYLEIKEMANRLESLRCELWQDQEHKKCMDNEDELQYVDDKMFSLQSQLRDLAGFCLIGLE